MRELLDQLGEQWDALSKALRGLADELCNGPLAAAAGMPDLPEHCGPFWRLMVDAAAGDRAISDAERQRLVGLAVAVVDSIKAELTVNFWRPNRQPAQDALGSRIFEILMASRLLISGRLVMPKALAPDGREHLIRWYGGRARPWLAAKVQDFAARMEVLPAGVRVQDLGYRWGSCGKGGWLYFHWKTILLPARIAEYVVVHEMAHLHEPHHTPAFWLRVERALPDFERRRAWLSERGMAVDGV